MGTHKNTTKSRIFVVKLTMLYFIYGVESVLWKQSLLKIGAFLHLVGKFNG